MYSTQMRRPQSSSLPVWGSITVIAAVAIGIGWGAVAAYNWASSYTISTGMRHGIVQKFSYKGPWASCSSYEGELVLIGLRSKTVTSPKAPDAVAAGLTNTWEFSTADKAIAQQIEDAASTGSPVTLHYKQSLLRGFCYTGTTYRIYKVTVDGNH